MPTRRSDTGAPVHLVFVSDEFHPGTPGGIGRLLNANALRLAAAGYRLTFLLEAPREAVETFRRYARANLAGAAVHDVDELIPGADPPERIPLWAFHFPLYHRSYRIALALRLLARRERIDGVEFNDFEGLGYVALKWRRLWGEELATIRMWVRLHGTLEYWIAADNGVLHSRERLQMFAMERYCLEHADGWISPSAGTAGWYTERYGPPATPPVIATPAFERLGTGRTHPRVLGPPPHRILFYGKLQRSKGADIFVRAMALLCEETDLPLAFEIVGGEVDHPSAAVSYRTELERLIPRRWRERFRFRGRIEPRELEGLARTCALAVVPSRCETFCLAAHELNWIGIPLVLADLPSFHDFFEDGRNARTFDGTSAGLARTIGELLRRPEPFASWEWNAPTITGGSGGAGPYPEALERFAPRVSPVEEAGAVSESPLVSVIVPYYNMHAYVEEALDSVRSSSYANWEVVLVDDGSTEPEAREKFQALEDRHRQDPRFRLFHKSNGGLGAARNFGIERARGEYILPLDSDDLLHPRFIELAVRALRRAPELSAVSSYVAYFKDGDSAKKVIDYVIPYDLHPILITLENRAGVASSLFRREVFERARYDEELIAYEDWDLWWQLAEGGARAETMPRILFHYRRRSDSMFNTTARARHTRLLEEMIQKHPTHLSFHATDVVRAHLQLAAALEEENALLRVSARGQLHRALRRLYREARKLRGL